MALRWRPAADLAPARGWLRKGCVENASQSEMQTPGDVRIGVYAWYVVVLLMLASVLSFLDRMMLSLLIDPIRKSLDLTDTKVSLLAGLAFALSYVAFAFPAGYWADNRGRRNVIALGVALWSLATMSCGLANTFLRLFLSRSMVGVGEATLIPTSVSLVPDYIPARRRGLAMSVLACGVSVGGGLALLAGGTFVDWANRAAPILPILGRIASWKLSFIAAGAPGIFLSLLILLTVREPKRHLTASAIDSHAPSMAEVLAYLKQHRAVFILMFAGFSGFAMNGYAFNVWGPAFFMRLHGFTPGDVGLLFGLGFGLGGTAGIVFGGICSDVLVRRGYPDAPVRVGLWSAWFQAPFFLAAYLLPNIVVVVPCFVIAMFGASIVGGLQSVMVQSLTPNRMRGLVGALYGACVNLAGLGIAPTVIALMADHFFGGSMGIGEALAVMSIASLAMTSALLWIGLPMVRERVLALQGGGHG
jgi:MFS family permease